MSVDGLIELVIPEGCRGLRLDRALADILPEQSRSTIRRWIDDGRVQLDGTVPRAKHAVNGGEQVLIDVPPPTQLELVAEPMDLDVVFEDDDIIVLNKPVGLVVHPGAGNWTGTLVQGLLGFDESLAALPRAGLVHRLDKDTSGLMVIARNEQTRIRLVERMAERKIERHYVALVDGEVIAGGTVDQNITRDSRDRRKMAVRADGRRSITHYRVRERFAAHTLLDIKLETGRTHQIRVHMKWIGFPITGDPVYGGRPRFPRNANGELQVLLGGFARQALHAERLLFQHPSSDEPLSFECGVPADMCLIIDALKINQRSDAL